MAGLFKFAKMKMSIEDLIIYACINNEMDRVKFQNELNIYYIWCFKWGLIINL